MRGNTGPGGASWIASFETTNDAMHYIETLRRAEPNIYAEIQVVEDEVSGEVDHVYVRVRCDS